MQSPESSEADDRPESLESSLDGPPRTRYQPRGSAPLPVSPNAPSNNSSPARPLQRPALLTRNGRVTGPIQLPMRNEESFVRMFNARYQSLGLRILFTDHDSQASSSDEAPT